MRQRLLRCLLTLAVTATLARAAVHFTEDFGAGWDERWSHSTEEKYNGKFVAEVPEGADDPALKVGCTPLAIDLRTSPATQLTDQGMK